jgi:hypothetical protein
MGKPIIIYEQIKEGKITLTKERFEEIMEQFYQTGVQDGQKMQYCPTTTSPTYPSWYNNTTLIKGTDITSNSAVDTSKALIRGITR